MSVVLKENLKQKLKKDFAGVFDELSVESLAEVVDFAEFLREKERRGQINSNPLKKERVFGMYDGQGWISDDFNDELGDEFWFGEDFGVIEKNDEAVD